MDSNKGLNHMDACDENFALSINILAFEGACVSPKMLDVFCERQFFPSSKSTQNNLTRNTTTPHKKSGFMTGKEKKLVQRG